MPAYIMELVEKWLTRNEVAVPRVAVDTSNLPTGAATEETLAEIKTVVEILDDMVDGSEAQVDVVAPLPAGTNTLGSLAIVPLTGGGCSCYRSIDLDETEEEVKGSGGQVYGFCLHNLHASDTRYVKFYDAPAVSVTVGTTTPAITIPLSAGQGAYLSLPQGLVFASGICIAATTGIADGDTGAPGANEVVGNVFYF